MAELAGILQGVRTIAVVGFSTEEGRPGHFVPQYLHAQGFRIIPVNPRVPEAWGERGYATLADIPEPVDLVLVFRRAEVAPEVVREALALTPRPQVIWLQSGLTSPEARRLAAAAGVAYVEDRCLMVEHRRLKHVA